MPEKEFNEVFSRRLRYYLGKNNMTQKDLAIALGVGTTAVSDWINGRKSPRMSKVDAMCDLFGCARSDLVEEKPEQDYYMNPETAKVAQEIYDDKDLHALFDAARDATPDELKRAKKFLQMLKETNPDG